MKRWARIGWLAVAAVGVAPSALAQSPADKAASTAIFEEARALSAAGRFAEACPKFAESLRLQTGIGTMLWLADCYESNGQTASAWAQFKEAASLAALRGDKRESVARQRAVGLEPKLARLTLRVSEPPVPGLTVQRDGGDVPVAQWGVGVPVDPGEHSVGAAAPGRQPWSTTVSMAAAGSSTVTIPPLAPEPEPEPEAPAPVLAIALEPPPPPTTLVVHPMGDVERPAPPAGAGRIAGLVTAGVGLAGLGVSAALAVDAKSTYDASNERGHCAANVCDGTGDRDRANARSLATGSTVAFVVGLAAVAGGTLLFLTAPADARRPSTAMTPSFGRDGASLVLTRTW